MYENKTVKETAESFETDIEKGLTEEEVLKRKEQYGANKLYEKPRQSPLIIFLSQFKDPMVFILFAAAIISLVLGIVEAYQKGEGISFETFADVIIIFGVVVLNAIIGTVQETKAEKALEALKKMSSPTATVRRDGKTIEIKAEDLVPGDIVILEEGRSVPADLRLIKTFAMKSDESSLTGESVPAEKDGDFTFTEEVGVGDRTNIVYMSTPIVHGRGEGIVIATGMNTEIGKIATMLSEGEDDLTPLQKNLNKLSKFLAYLTIGIVVLVLLVKLIWALVNQNLADVWSEALLTSVGLAVAAIPEGLTAVVTIVLALGMQKMIKVNTIVRKLASVETLGAVSVICSDKTGTLTQNKMTVVEAYVDGNTFEQSSFNEDNVGLLAKGMALCSDASIENGIYGDPTEVALVQMASDIGLTKSKLEQSMPRIDEAPFDSVRKMMSTKHSTSEGTIIFTKGAMDQIIKRSKKVLINGKEADLTADIITKIQESASLMAKKALRVLALAYSKEEEIKEDDMVFVGLVGMIDPPRPAAKPAVATLKQAGITTIMITGDHKDTAFAIASDLGIASSIDQCMSGEQIDECSEDELKEKVKTIRVFARVSPENKVSIVKAIKANGNIAAMTGDGVNDAPSLKAADIGIAMGITGTDVAKGAADMVLTDDNFASIEAAVEEGRGIYANIRKTILFLLSSNIGEVVAMLVASLIGLPSPLIAIHLLWVNLITDSLPAVALGVDKKPKDIMNDKPRNPNESIFGKDGYFLTFGYGIIIGLATLFAFLVKPWMNGYYSIAEMQGYFDNPINLEEAQSMAFCVLSFSELFHMLGMTNIKKSFVTVFGNKNLILWLSFFLGLGLQFFVIETPGVNSFFSVYPLHDQPIDYLFVFALALSPLVMHEIVVLVRFIKKKTTK